MKRKALLFGNQTFTDRRISNLCAPEQDVRALKKLLKNDDLIIPYQVNDFLNSTLKKMKAEVIKFFEKAQKTDLLLFYYSGHGERDDQNNFYLYTKDTKKDKIAETAFNINFIKDIVKKTKANIKVLLLDCCQGGVLPLEFDVLSSAKPKGLQDTGIAVMTASRSLECAYEKKYSYFTECIIGGITSQRLEIRNNTVSFVNLWEYIRNNFEKSSLQKPVLNVYTSCEIPIVEYRASVERPPEKSKSQFPGKIIIPAPARG